MIVDKEEIPVSKNNFFDVSYFQQALKIITSSTDWKPVVQEPTEEEKSKIKELLNFTQPVEVFIIYNFSLSQILFLIFSPLMVKI